MGVTRLSVIILATSTDHHAERAIASVLKQADPIGTEVILIDPSPDQRTQTYLKSRFAKDVELETLRFLSVPATSNAARLRNEGARFARGGFLAFLDPQDEWLYGRLIELWPIIEEFDLILSPRPDYSGSKDWLREFLRRNQGSGSAAVVRRSLFEAACGFRESSFLLGETDYEFWLKCLGMLERAGRRKRFMALPAHNIKVAARETGTHRRMREAVSIARVCPKLPRRYWGAAVRYSLSRFISHT